MRTDLEVELLTPEEDRIVCDILTNNLEGKCSNRFITIMPESIYFRYLESGRASMGIVNPSQEIPLVDEWHEYKLTKSINDDWGIEIYKTIPG